VLREVGIKAASLLAAREAPAAPAISESSVITSAGSRVLIAAAVGIAYYAGAQIGFLLKLPPGTPSAIWPPNAILMATLLLLRPREWWLALVAALPGHLAVELRAGWPMSLVLALYVTNCSEALIGAVGVRLLSDAPGRFDSLPRMAAYIAAGGLLAPIISSFADAAVVSTFRGDLYWDVWRARTSGNILTDLTLVPALVAVVRDGRQWLATARPRVHLEAVVLAVTSIAVSAVTFATPAIPLTVPRTFVMPLGFLLPILLWAAVRFGPAGVSLVLVEIAVFANWGSLNSRGPFQGLAPPERVLALQLGLSVIAVPILCLAALIEERWRTEGELGERLAFEQVLSRMSAALVLASGRGIEHAAAIWLGKLAVFLEVDCAWLLKRGADDQLVLASSWVAPGVPVMSSIDPRRDLGGVVRRLNEQDAVLLENVDDLPPAERAPLRRLGVRGLYCLPIGAAGRVVGGLVFASVGRPRAWSDVLRGRLQLVSEVFASALARQAADEALRAGEAMKSSILASLSSGVAVVDRSGTIVAVNERWTSLAHDQHEIVTGDVGVGANYLQLSLHAAVQGAPHAGAVHAGLEAVLGRSRSSFTLEYQTDGPAGERWAVLSVVPLSGAQGGAVITHTDITERRRAEMEAERSRQELAHFARVSAMGELTASLAHQLNQPLTGILTNAQAAQRLLHDPAPDLPELRSILEDIVEDDRRAGEVIQQLRDLMRKAPSDRVLLDMNTTLERVVRLVSSDAVIRSVTIDLDLTPDMAIVRGNRVELQQVILNLLLNALDAVSRTEERRITVRTLLTPEGIEVRVEDSGHGIALGAEGRIFEPFFTSKPDGMGMGLSVARSIVDAHGGRIYAKRRDPLGSIVAFELPAAGGRAV
jgi:signal transduction histidine kinase